MEAIRRLLSDLQRSAQFNTSLNMSENFHEMDEEKSIILFRIVQEIINNIIRHSNATDIKVAINGDGFLESIIITDNGKGFDTAIISQQLNGGALIILSHDLK